jgi:hypothetical protein
LEAGEDERLIFAGGHLQRGWLDSLAAELVIVAEGIEAGFWIQRSRANKAVPKMNINT